MAHVRRVGGKRGPSTSELWSAIKQLQHEKKVGKRERRRTGGRQAPSVSFLCEKSFVRFFSWKANENCILPYSDKRFLTWVSEDGQRGAEG